MLVKQHVHVWYTHARVRMVLYFSSVFFFCIYFHSSSVPFYLHLSHSLCAILWTCLFVAFSYRLLRGAVRCDRIIIRARTRWRAIAAAAKRIRDSTRRDHRTAPMILVCTIMYAVYRMLCYTQLLRSVYTEGRLSLGLIPDGTTWSKFLLSSLSGKERNCAI